MLTAVLIVGSAYATSEIPEAKALGQASERFGNYEVHFSAFNSTFIPPAVVAQYNLRRGERYGIVNIAINDVSNSELGTAITGQVTGHTTNLLTQKMNLSFSKVKRGQCYILSGRLQICR